MSRVEYKYLIVSLEYPTFISMRFFDKVFFNGCGATAAAMLNFILVPSLSNLFTPTHSRPQALASSAPLSTAGTVARARSMFYLGLKLSFFFRGVKAKTLFVVSGLTLSSGFSVLHNEMLLTEQGIRRKQLSLYNTPV